VKTALGFTQYERKRKFGVYITYRSQEEKKGIKWEDRQEGGDAVTPQVVSQQKGPIFLQIKSEKD